MTKPHAVLLPPKGDCISSHVRMMEKAVGDAPETPVIALVYAETADSEIQHRSRLAALHAYMPQAARLLAPDTRIVGISPGSAETDEKTLTGAIADAITLAVENPAITGQVLVVTGD